jgi:hypothetical protein
MSDQIQVVVAVSRDEALPVDVQGVGLRRMAIDLMSEIAEVEENSVRYRGGTDDSVVLFGDYAITLWQHNLLAARFTAKGKTREGICGPVIKQDRVTRVYSSASVVRDGMN